MTIEHRGVVVPAIPPPPPVLTLLNSAIRPASTFDADGINPTSDQLADLPQDLRDELAARKGEAWVRGLTYAPENHWAAEVRDPCDFTSVDLPAIPAPLDLEGKPGAGGGTLPAEGFEYAVTALNANGETTGSAPITVKVLAEGHVVLTWHKVGDAISYRVYRCKEGVKKPLRIKEALVPAPDEESEETVTYTDKGTATEAGKELPLSNTTGGPGPYTNAPIITAIPWLIISPDWCATFGFEERDFKGRAERLLENAQHKALEHEFWTGQLAQEAGWPNHYLTNEEGLTDVTPGGGPPSVARGLQILQDALAQCGFGGQGMIHCQQQTATNLLTVRRVGNLLLDIFDNLVVPGVGYPGTGPGGEEPESGKAWIYATDMPMARVEPEATIFPETFAEATDWGQGPEPNTIRFRAQKFGVAYFDDVCRFGCEVTLAS